MGRFALPTGPREARPSRLTLKDPWSTSPRLLRRGTRSVASRDSNYSHDDLEQIEGAIAYNHTILIL